MFIARVTALASVFTAILTLSVAYGQNQISDSAQEFSPPSEVKLEGKTSMIVTHPGTEWDVQKVAKKGIDFGVEFAKKKSWPTVYLQAELDTLSYYPSVQTPDHIVLSSAGEFSFEVKSKRVVSMGGWFSNCHKQSVRDILKAFSKSPKKNRKLFLAVDGIYEGVNNEFASGLLDHQTQRRLEGEFAGHTVPLEAILDEVEEEDAFNALVGFAEQHYSLHVDEYPFNFILTYGELTKRWTRDKSLPTVHIRFIRAQR